MIGNFTYLQLVKQVLNEAEYPLDPHEIWIIASEKGLTSQLKPTLVENAAALRNFLEKKIEKNKSQIIQTSKNPTTFWLKSRQKELPQNKMLFKERDLHALLVYFLKKNKNFNAISKTITHLKSLKYPDGKRRWGYPDVVAMYSPTLENETIDLLSHFNQRVFRFYSFELKRAIDNFGDLKEFYFQAISNSSWANEGYLVVFKDIKEDLLEELERLNQSFGIGVIQLEKNPMVSKILLPARRRDLDIETLNMLVKDNSVFRKFVREVSNYISASLQKCKKLPNIDADKVLTDEELTQHITDKKIDK